MKLDTVDFAALVERNTMDVLQTKSKIVDEINKTFTEDEKKWYVSNLYMSLNYDPIDDYPIELDNIWKLIGFSHKGNAKRTLINNFTQNEDYKILDGNNKEIIMLNMDTFKHLCMMTKTEKAKEIRQYYRKLDNLFHKLINEEYKDANHIN
jgi:phage anti-repressor protein